MSELVRLPGREIEPSAFVPLPSVVNGDDVELRFAAASWSQTYDRRMPSEGVSRVLGLQALSNDSFSVEFDSDGGLGRGGTLGMPDLTDVITAERNRKDQAPEGNTLAAILVNGKPAWYENTLTVRDDMSSELLGTTRKHTELEGAEVARACREGDLLWNDVPKRMFVDIYYGQSVYCTPEGDHIPRKELLTYAIRLRAWGAGGFKVLEPIHMLSARTTDRFDVGRNVHLEAWAKTLKQGMRVRCFSGEGQSGLALARAPLTIIERDAANPADSELVREQRAHVQRAMSRLGMAQYEKAPRVLNIDFGATPTSDHDTREALRTRTKRELTESVRYGRTAPDGRHGGYAVTD